LPLWIGRSIVAMWKCNHNACDLSHNTDLLLCNTVGSGYRQSLQLAGTISGNISHHLDLFLTLGNDLSCCFRHYESHQFSDMPCSLPFEGG